MDVFSDVIAKGVRAGQIPARTKESREWFREAAGKINSVSENAFSKDADRQIKNPIVGSMYMFHYDPKHKKTLPYYDKFPLIFPFKKVAGGFYGINLHYLPPLLRAQMMDALYEISNNPRYDESTKLKINWSIIQSLSKTKLFKPTVKHYLSNHVRSQFIYVFPSEWDIALFLPTERFMKAGKQDVWKDSKMIIKGKQVKPVNTVKQTKQAGIK